MRASPAHRFVHRWLGFGEAESPTSGVRRALVGGTTALCASDLSAACRPNGSSRCGRGGSLAQPDVWGTVRGRRSGGDGDVRKIAGDARQIRLSTSPRKCIPPAIPPRSRWLWKIVGPCTSRSPAGAMTEEIRQMRVACWVPSSTSKQPVVGGRNEMAAAEVYLRAFRGLRARSRTRAAGTLEQWRSSIWLSTIEDRRTLRTVRTVRTEA